MSSSASRRIFRVEPAEDVFVLGGTPRELTPEAGPLSTVSDLVDGARRRAEQLLADAEAKAAELIAAARAEADAIRDTARVEGFTAGQSAGQGNAEDEVAELVALVRQAAAEGLAIRNAIIDDATPAMASAIALAARRVVGAAYQADPTLVAEACAEAVRAAAGQQILSIRVNPGALDTVRAALVDVADYVRPDSGVSIGGCIVDLRNGAIDATLDARLGLVELALRAAGGDR